MIPKDDSVNLRGLSAEGWWAVYVADRVHKRMAGQEVVITSARDSRHAVKRSAHYRGDAIDVRIWHVKDREVEFSNALAAELGGAYVVILEDTHVHIHYAPTYSVQP